MRWNTQKMLSNCLPLRSATSLGLRDFHRCLRAVQCAKNRPTNTVSSGIGRNCEWSTEYSCRQIQSLKDLEDESLSMIGKYSKFDHKKSVS